MTDFVFSHCNDKHKAIRMKATTEERLILPKRTEKTSLSNDELLILDFLALVGPTTLKVLSAEEYPWHMNSPYTHSISKQDIAARIEDMRKSGLVNIQTIPHGISMKLNRKREYIMYSITSFGGKQWELERNPVWSRYCVCWQENICNDEEENTLAFYCVDKEIGRKCAEITLQANLYNFQLNKLKVSPAPPGSLLPWKNFPHEFVWTVQSYFEVQDYKSEVYHQHRIWWSTLEELQIFL